LGAGDCVLPDIGVSQREKSPAGVFSERILEEVSLAYETVAESANERRAALARCLEKLGEEKRHVVEEYYLSAEPAQKIADRLSMSPNALRQLLFRIRKTLFNCVERTVQSEMRG
jgi:RNA polymerase sigma-70 factor, ECF subfamily